MEPGDPTLRVPTDVVRVDVAFADETPRVLDLFCPPAAARQGDRRRLEGLLARDAAFLPSRDPVTGSLLALGARAIVWIAMPLVRSVVALDEDELFEQRRDVRLELHDGEVLLGELLYTAPAASARVLDLLNGAARFLPVWVGERVVYVQKKFIRRVAEIERPSRVSSLAPPAPGPER